MPLPSAEIPLRTRVIAVLAIAAAVGFSIWLRWPGFTQGGFASHDVGGILYNAMVLRDGELPYVAAVELKAPGAFYLAWALTGDGTDIARLQIWANAWAVAALLATVVLGGLLFGWFGAVRVAWLAALVDAHLDSMDANYVTWAQLPLVTAFAWAVAARRARGRVRAFGFAVAGALAGVAVMIKQPSGVVAAALVVAIVLADHPVATRRRDAAALLAGALAIHVPLALHYAVAGELATLFRNYPINTWGLEYVVAGGQAGAWPWPVEGALATAYFLALPLGLAAFAPRPLIGRADVTLVWAWLGAAIAAAWVGARFYKGYFVPAAPAACLLAAAPWGWLAGAPGRATALRWAFAPLVLAALVRQLALDVDMRRDRARAHDEGARQLAAFLRPRLPPDARIWVWGWHLWDLYALVDARSASRVYKTFGLITGPNDDTWRRGATPLHVVEGPATTMLIEDLERNLPAYVVLGATAPHRELPALHALLRRAYVRDHGVRLGRLELWRHRDVAP